MSSWQPLHQKTAAPLRIERKLSYVSSVTDDKKRENRMAAPANTEETWWSGWWSPTSKPDYRRQRTPLGRPTLPLECNPSVEGLSDSTVRFVAHPTGMDLQVNSSEPLGVPRLSLHQNHHAATLAPGSTLGALQIGSRDDTTASVSAFVDGAWSSVSHPTGFAMRVTPPGSTAPRYPAFTMRADGRVAIGGGPTAVSSSLVSLGVYRRGVMELPSVERYADLLSAPSSEPFVNGAIVYARDLERVLISQNGSWHAILSTPVSQLLPKEESLPDGGWAAEPEPAPTAPPAAQTWRRVMGAPRKDGRPTVFGPRTPSS